MKGKWAIGLTLVAIAGLLFATSAQAADPLDAVAYDMAAFADEQPQQVTACDECGTCDVCCDPCGCAGFFGGAELLLLDPHSSAGTNALGVGGPYPEWGYRPAYRFWLGYQGSGGQGLRLRYFQFDQYNEDVLDAANPEQGGFETAGVGFNAYYVDVEYTDTIQLGGQWSALLHGGMRYAAVDRFDMAYDAGVGTTYGRYLTCSWGVTGGLELRRPIFAGWDLYANLQGSILFGDGDEYNWTDDPPSWDGENHLENGTQAIWEISFGMEKAYDLGNGAELFGRVGVEAQYWDGFQREFVAGGTYEQGEAFGLYGYTIALGINR